jgi:hypothetical protein
MMKRIVGAVVLLAAAAGSALPQETDRAFVASVVEALNSKSLERRRALLHPKSLPCAGTEADSFYSWMLARQFKDTVPANYKWKLTPIPSTEPLMFADHFDYPIRPTHTLQLDFSPAPFHIKTMLLQVVHEGNRWYEMMPCPKPETIAAARAARKAEAERTQRVQALAAAIAPELKAQVLALLKAGRRIEAINHYKAASGEDLTTSTDVVELLAPLSP